jgi:peptidylprolyl isomerase
MNIKNPLNRNETIGIIGSVLIMVAVLFFLGTRSQGNPPKEATTTHTTGTVVVNSASSSGQSSLSDALTQAGTLQGNLTKLIINDVKVGTGQAVKEGDSVTVNYIGVTRDGVQFDSSYSRGTPYSFTVGAGKVIQGWEKGLVGMKVGGERILIIPPDMGYGNRQVGPIKPNSILIFAVQLVSIDN